MAWRMKQTSVKECSRARIVLVRGAAVGCVCVWAGAGGGGGAHARAAGGMPESGTRRAARETAIGRMNLIAAKYGIARLEPRPSNHEDANALRRRLLRHLHPGKQAAIGPEAVADFRTVIAVWQACNAAIAAEDEQAAAAPKAFRMRGTGFLLTYNSNDFDVIGEKHSKSAQSSQKQQKTTQNCTKTAKNRQKQH